MMSSNCQEKMEFFMAKPKKLKHTVPGIWRLLKYLQPYIRPHRALLAGSFSALLAGVVMRALEPWPLQVVFDYVIVPAGGKSGAGVPWLQKLDPMAIVAGSALAIVVILILRALSTYYQKVGFALVGNRALTEVRGDLFRHIQCLSLAFHNRARSGDLILRVIGDIGLLKEFSITALMPLIGSVLILVVMAGLMLWLNWKLALLVILSLPVYWLPTYLLSKKIQSVSRTQRKREGEMASLATESIGAMQVIQTLALEDNFAEQFAGHSGNSLNVGVKAKRLLAKLESTVQAMTGVSTALVLSYGTFLIISGQLTAGELLVFLSYLKAAFKPMQDFSKYSGRMAKAMASGERVMEMFDTRPDVADHPSAEPAPEFSGAIDFDNVSYAYEPGRPVLKNLNLSIRPGQMVALVGPSGSGKSTIIGLISRLYDPSEGRVLIDGRDIRFFTLASLRRQISVVLQDTTLFAISIRENIAIGAPEVSDDEIRAAARLARAHEFIEALPEGYDTVVGERGVTLSTGQRQRIALARATLSGSPILILDEPTSGLDEENSQAVMQALKNLAAGKTVILITHQMKEAAPADRIFRIERGVLRDYRLDEAQMQLQV
jgi:ATP-binding cassette subfamily B protein